MARRPREKRQQAPPSARTAVVTGGAVRLGRELVVGLARAGWRVAYTYHRSTIAARELARLAQAEQLAISGLRCDLTDVKALRGCMRRVASAVGAIDLVINSAAGFERVPFEVIKPAQYDALADLNLRAPFFVTQALLPALRAATDRGGTPCVVNIADVAGERPWRGYSHYCPTKAGLLMLTQCLARELAPAVRVNAVAIGTIDPPAATPAAERERLRRGIPLQRFAAPGELLRAVLYLVENRAVTGEVLHLDGGRRLA